MNAVARGRKSGSAPPGTASTTATPDAPTAAPERETFAARFDRLLRHFAPEGWQSYNLQQLADEIVELGGPAKSADFYRRLRSGDRPPSLEAAQWIARHFGVPLTYFDLDPLPGSEDPALVAARAALTSRIDQVSTPRVLTLLSELMDQMHIGVPPDGSPDVPAD